ncbi:nucleoside diphosphate kinase 6-like [Dysidea avara]|uniref:nucleoside diphosphate kinase 6-like n=1 Tax=Dysidea avara TaxID=196820 RepID=UPI00332F1F7B
MKGGNALQLTVAILKPDLVARPRDLQLVEQRILKEGFYIVRRKLVHLKRHETEAFYNEHCDKFFYNRLVTYMSSGPMKPMILAGYNAVSQWRELMGPTKISKAKMIAPDSIRSHYGLTDTRNSVHGSDGEESFLKESQFFFPDFNPIAWQDKCESLFRQGNVYYDITSGIHLVSTN